jgi:hypothetical protein
VCTDLGQGIEQQLGTRADLARQLLARVERLQTRLAESPLAAGVQLLKRELVRGHVNDMRNSTMRRTRKTAR